MEASRLEIIRTEAQKEWLRVLSTELTHPNVLKPIAMHLMILEIVEGDGTLELIAVPFSCDPRERLNQVQNAWTESSARRTIPAGIIFIGVNDVGPADGVRFVAPHVVAEISNDDVEQLTDWMSDCAAVIASGVLRALGIIPKGEVDIIVER